MVSDVPLIVSFTLSVRKRVTKALQNLCFCRKQSLAMCVFLFILGRGFSKSIHSWFIWGAMLAIGILGNAWLTVTLIVYVYITLIRMNFYA